MEWTRLPYRYKPVRSGVDCLQDDLDDDAMPEAVPWRLLVACCLLNRTKVSVAKPTFYRVINRWSRPDSMARAEQEELAERIRSLGMQHVRAQRLIAMSEQYARGDFDDVVQLPTVGDYARDAWSIWVLQKLPTNKPRDKVLGAIWCALGGVSTDANAFDGVQGLRRIAEVAGISVHMASHALKEGIMRGRHIGGSRGWVTTRRAIADFVEGQDAREGPVKVGDK